MAYVIVIQENNKGQRKKCCKIAYLTRGSYKNSSC
jgi:hypothetical protein